MHVVVPDVFSHPPPLISISANCPGLRPIILPQIREKGVQIRSYSHVASDVTDSEFEYISVTG
jgi:hypothetical protein